MNKKIHIVEILIILVGLAFVLGFYIGDGSVGTDPDLALTPVAEPASGQVLSGSEDFYGSEITIKASVDEACVVKLKTRSGVERLSFYVRAGDTVTIGVPCEYLYVYFASGDTWYGTSHLFGKNTSYQKVSDVKDFTEYTWEFTLYKVSNGNLTLDSIDADEFR